MQDEFVRAIPHLNVEDQAASQGFGISLVPNFWLLRNQAKFDLLSDDRKRAS